MRPVGAGRRRLGRKTIPGESQETCHKNPPGNVLPHKDLESIQKIGNLWIPTVPPGNPWIDPEHLFTRQSIALSRARNSSARSTMPFEPMKRGVLWWSSVGTTSMMSISPVLARPPACSAMKASGAAS